MNKIITFLIVSLLLIIPTQASLPLEDLKKVGNYYEYKDARLQQLMTETGLSYQNIGTTQGKRTIYFTSYGKVTQERVAVIARQHGGESGSSFVMEGFLLESLKDKEYTDRFRTYAVPFANPDGAELDRWYNLAGQNTNRYWNTNKCYETEHIKGRLYYTNLPRLDVFIDLHALNGGEQTGVIKISSKYNMANESLCEKANKYLPELKCSVEKCPDTNTARGYYCVKGVRYSVVVDIAQMNKSITPQVAYDIGEGLKDFIKELKTT